MIALGYLGNTALFVLLPILAVAALSGWFLMMKVGDRSTSPHQGHPTKEPGRRGGVVRGTSRNPTGEIHPDDIRDEP